MTDVPEVLYVCTHNAGRSVAAAVLTDHYAQRTRPCSVRGLGIRGARSTPRSPRSCAERGLDPDQGVPQAAHRRSRAAPPTSSSPWAAATPARLSRQALPRLGAHRSRRQERRRGPAHRRRHRTACPGPPRWTGSGCRASGRHPPSVVIVGVRNGSVSRNPVPGARYRRLSWGRSAAMALEWEQVIVDSRDSVLLGQWWRDVLGWVVVEDRRGEFEIRPTPDRMPGLLFVEVLDEKITKNRLHIDLRPDDQATEVARLEAMGATRVDLGQDDQSWVVLADPEGNEFCVLGGHASRNRFRQPLRQPDPSREGARRAPGGHLRDCLVKGYRASMVSVYGSRTPSLASPRLTAYAAATMAAKRQPSSTGEAVVVVHVRGDEDRGDEGNRHEELGGLLSGLGLGRPADMPLGAGLGGCVGRGGRRGHWCLLKAQGGNSPFGLEAPGTLTAPAAWQTTSPKFPAASAARIAVHGRRMLTNGPGRRRARPWARAGANRRSRLPRDTSLRTESGLQRTSGSWAGADGAGRAGRRRVRRSDARGRGPGRHRRGLLRDRVAAAGEGLPGVRAGADARTTARSRQGWSSRPR